MKLSRAVCAMAVVGWLLLCAARATAQLQPIAEMPITLSGSLSAGYAGGSSSALGSSSGLSDSLALGVNADLNGYYHDPRFLQFSADHRFLWTRTGSPTAAALHDRNDGVDINVNFLQGSNTPIHFTYDISQLNSSTLSGGPTPFTVGATGLSKSFSIGAAHRFEYLPPLNITYSRSSADTEVIGANAPTSHMQHDFLNLFSNYELLGFHLSGSYTHSTSESHVDDLLNLGLPVAPSNSTSQSENFGVSHNLPLHGAASVTFSHSNDSYETGGTPQTGSYDTAASSVTLAPTQRLSMSASASYTSNATQQAIFAVVNGQPTGQAVLGFGRSLSMETSADYRIGHGFSVMGSGSHQVSDFQGEELIQNVGVGTLYYGRLLWHGAFYASYSPGWSSTEFGSPGSSSLTSSGLYHAGTAGYTRQAGRWNVQGAFSFLRNSAYLAGIAPVVARSFSGTGRARTRIRYNWNLALSAVLGSSQVDSRNSSGNQLFSAQVANRTWSLNGQWQRTSGYFLFTGPGTTPVVTTGVGVPGLIPFYSTSQGYTLAGTYSRRRLTLQASYSKNSGTFDTLTVPATTANSYLEAKAYYKFRKLDMQAGYRRLTQSASTNGVLDQVSNAYWVSVVRQFRAF
jgi:hypothetical protein